MPGIFESLKKTPLATLNERLSDLAGFFFEISRMKASQVAAQQALQGLQQLGQGVEGPAGEYIRGVAQSLMPLGAVPGVDPTKIAGVYETLAQIKYNEAVNQITKQAVQETLGKLTDVYNKMTETTLKSIKETPMPKTGFKEIDEIIISGQKAIIEGINAQLNLAKVQLEGLKELAQKPNIKLDYSMVDKALGVLEGLSNVLSKYASPEAQMYRANILAQASLMRQQMIEAQKERERQQKEQEKQQKEALKLQLEMNKLFSKIKGASEKIASDLGVQLMPNEIVYNFRINYSKDGLVSGGTLTIKDIRTGQVKDVEVKLPDEMFMKLMGLSQRGSYIYNPYSKETAEIQRYLTELNLLQSVPDYQSYLKLKEINSEKDKVELPKPPAGTQSSGAFSVSTPDTSKQLVKAHEDTTKTWTQQEILEKGYILVPKKSYVSIDTTKNEVTPKTKKDTLNYLPFTFSSLDWESPRDINVLERQKLKEILRPDLPQYYPQVWGQQQFEEFGYPVPRKPYKKEGENIDIKSLDDFVKFINEVYRFVRSQKRTITP
jgi:hypothetical protein